MKIRLLARTASVALLALSVVGAFSQNPESPAVKSLDIAELVKGDKLPASIKPADLPDDYKAVEIKVGSGASYLDALMPLIGMSGGSGRDKRMFTLMGLMEVSWTKGEIISVTSKDSSASGEFLIAYKLDMGLLDLVVQGDSNPSPQIMLKLVLTRTDQIASISPRPRIDKRVLLSVDETTAAVVGEPTGAQMAAKRTQTISNLKQIALAMMMYANDYDDVLPYAQSTTTARAVTYPYTKNKEVYKSANPLGGMFRFNMALAGVSMSAIAEPANTVMYYENGTWPDGTRGVAFADGHVSMVKPAEWDKLSASLQLKFKRTGKPLPANYLVKDDPLGGQQTASPEEGST